MIIFKNWKITANGRLLAMQYDNLSRELKIVGEIPEGYTWSAMVQAGELFDIILLEPQADGSLSSSLSAQQLSVSGDYIVQLKGVKDNIVRHTNQLTVFVGDSLSGDANWPEIPSEFTQIEQRVYKAMHNAAASEEMAFAARDSAKVFAGNAESMANAAAGQAKVAESFKNMAEDAALRADRSWSDADVAAKNAKSSETAASNSAAESKASAAAAAVSETNAKNSEQHAYLSADEARQSASDLAHAVNMAEMHAGAAGDFAASAEQKKEAAETAAKTAASNATAAAASAKAAAESAKEAASHSPEGYAPKDSPVFTGSISLGRMEGTDVGDRSFAVGMDVTASGDYSHAEGSSCQAVGSKSHAEGGGTMAYGKQSHTEGEYTFAEGENSHAEGEHTSALSKNQHVQGRYNIGDDEGKYAHIVGNGYMGDGRVHGSNAHTLDWDGNAWFAGSVEGTALILKSPSGKRFKITVNDSGNLSAAALT